MMILLSSIAKVGGFQVRGVVARSHVGNGSAKRAARSLSSRPALADPVLTLRQQDDRSPSPEQKPAQERSEADSTGFFDRMGRPRYIAAPMVEQSEAGEFASRSDVERQETMKRADVNALLRYSCMQRFCLLWHWHFIGSR